MADIVLAAKANAAPAEDVQRVMEAARRLNPSAAMLRAGSRVTLEEPAAVRGRRVLVVEDGPTLTHGGMPDGAGHAAALAAGAAEIVDPRRAAAPSIAAVYAAFPHLGPVLPAMGYDAAQLHDMRETIARSGAEVVVSATPADLARLIALDVPIIRARYDYEELDTPGLAVRVDAFLDRRRRSGGG